MGPERKNRIRHYIKNHPTDFAFILISGLTALVVGLSFPLWVMMGMGYTDSAIVKSGTGLAFGISACYPSFWGLLLFFRSRAKNEPMINIRNFLVNLIQFTLLASWVLAVWGFFKALKMMELI